MKREVKSRLKSVYCLTLTRKAGACDCLSATITDQNSSAHALIRAQEAREATCRESGLSFRCIQAVDHLIPFSLCRRCTLSMAPSSQEAKNAARYLRSLRHVVGNKLTDTEILSWAEAGRSSWRLRLPCQITRLCA